MHCHCGPSAMAGDALKQCSKQTPPSSSFKTTSHLLDLIYFVSYVWMFCLHMSVHHMCVMLMETIRGRQIPLDMTYRQW